MENGKEWWKSKTFWFNVVYILGLVFSAIAAYVGYDQFEPSQDVVVLGSAILAIVNIVLRWLTKQPLRW